MITHQEFLDALKVVNDYKDQMYESAKAVDKTVGIANLNPETKISDTDIPNQVIYRLRCHIDIDEDNFKLKHLIGYSVSKLKSYRGIGSKRVKEIQNTLQKAGIYLKP